jgi:hypothetical protein
MLPAQSCLSRKLAAVILLAFFGDPAQAITLASKGGGVVISGKIKQGDQFEFRDFVNQNNPRFVELNSGGGTIEAAGEIGRIIRAKKLPTVVDASVDRCGSACTIIFASGVSRHYVAAEKIQERVDKTNGRGLGYHEGNSFLANGKKGQSGRATGAAIGWYYEFGSGKAASLATKADWKHFYYISAATALEMGIATSTNRP